MGKKRFSIKESTGKLWPFMVTLIGSILAAFSLSFFIIPYKIVSGGASGLSTIIFYITNGRLPVGVTIILINIPLFLLGYKKIGRSFLIHSLFGMLSLSLFTDLFSQLTKHLKYSVPMFIGFEAGVPDLLLYSLFGGMLMGAGLGIVLSVSSSTGGTEIASKLIERKFPWIPMGKIMLIIDASIVIIASVVFESLSLGLYALACIYISSKTIDAVLEGFAFARAAFIISSKNDEIANRIINEINRGVTIFKGIGVYTGEPRDTLFCVVDRRQFPQIKALVKEIDKKAFVILTDVREVLGEGFKPHEKE